MTQTIEDSKQAPEQDTAARLRRATARLSRGLRRTQAGAGLTSTEVAVLGSVVRHGPIGLGRLAAEENLNPTMLSRVVRRLEMAGILARHTAAHDGRAAVVEATQQGEVLHESIRQERAAVLTEFLNRLDSKDLAALVEALAVLERLAEELLERP
jgi:DNA-binding MarR family transcriptional regulator